MLDFGLGVELDQARASLKLDLFLTVLKARLGVSLFARLGVSLFARLGVSLFARPLYNL
jgi:hypothetical protein